MPAVKSSVKPFKEMDLARTLERIIAIAVSVCVCVSLSCGSCDDNNGLQIVTMVISSKFVN